MKIVNNIPENIFRGYDIRGIVGEEITQDTAYTIGRAYASNQVLNSEPLDVVVGQDNRLSSPEITQGLIQGLVDSGATVHDIGIVTTPMLYFSKMYLGIYGGIMVTASHNPKQYNGFKFSFNASGAVYGDGIQEFKKYVAQSQFVNGCGSVKKVDVKAGYLDKIKQSINIGTNKIKVVVDCGNGATACIIHDVLDMYKDVVEVEYLLDTLDGNFPIHHPDPLNEENLELLKKKVLESNATCGLAFDGDGDRCGVVTNSARFLPIDMLLIFYARNMINSMVNKNVIVDIKCGNALKEEMQKLGGNVVLSRVGNPYIKQKMKENGYVLGGELSGHIFFKDRWPNIDDGIYAGLRVLEILTNTTKTMDMLLDNTSNYVSVTDRVRTTEKRKYEIIEEIENYCKIKKYECIDIDGVRVDFLDNSWILVRYSNTEPAIEYRIEAKSRNKVEEIMEEFSAFLKG